MATAKAKRVVSVDLSLNEEEACLIKDVIGSISIKSIDKPTELMVDHLYQILSTALPNSPFSKDYQDIVLKEAV